MDKVVLDTDILSEILKARNVTVLEHVAVYRTDFEKLTLSAITVMEIVSGLHKKERAEAMQQFLDGLTTCEVLAFDQLCAETAGRILADLERTGQPVGRADPMIAAIALEHDLVLVTGNVEHYARIQALGYSLRLDNWRE